MYMDLDKVVAELIEERNLIDRAIAHLERLSPKRSGRVQPPIGGRHHPQERKPDRAQASGSTVD